MPEYFYWPINQPKTGLIMSEFYFCFRLFINVMLLLKQKSALFICLLQNVIQDYMFDDYVCVYSFVLTRYTIIVNYKSESFIRLL